MGCSIMLKQAVGWADITPGWRGAMATMLYEIGGDREVLAFTDADVPRLEYRREHQRIGETAPPFDRSEDWVKCFDAILEEIRVNEVALVRISW